MNLGKEVTIVTGDASPRKAVHGYLGASEGIGLAVGKRPLERSSERLLVGRIDQPWMIAAEYPACDCIVMSNDR